MKTSVVCSSLLLVVASFGLKIVLIMGFSSFDQIDQEREELFKSTGMRRVLYRALYFYIDNRYVFGVLGCVTFLLALALDL